MLPPILTGSRMDVRNVGGVRLFRPRLEGEVIARNEAEKHLREGYASGKYDDPKKINEILQHQFTYFSLLLRTEIPKSSSRHLMEFLLAQYDATVEIVGRHKKSGLSPKDSDYWEESGPTIRRAIKHLAEIVTMLTPQEAPQLGPEALLLNLDTIVICAEMLVEFYMLSDQTHGVHPDDTILVILPEGGHDYIDVTVANHARYADFPDRINADTASQGTYLGMTPLRYGLDFQEAAIGNAFLAELGSATRTRFSH